MSSFAYVHEDKGVRAVPLNDAEAAFGKCRFVWIHLDGRDEASVAWLRQQRDIPETVANALTARETRPRLEAIGPGALVNLRGLSTKPDADADSLVSIRLWAERARVISLGLRPLAAMAAAREKMEAGHVCDPGDLITILAVKITAALDPEIAALGDAVDDCEAALDVKNAFGMRRQIAKSRATAIDYRRFVVPQRQALEQLSVVDTDWLEDSDRLHLREAADRFARMGEELEAVRERAALLHEQITDLRAELLDTRGLLLSIVALVFLPLTFISGLLGMNVAGIPFAHEPWAFAAVCGLCLAIALAITGWFAMAHWFKR